MNAEKALELIRQFGTIDVVLENIDRFPSHCGIHFFHNVILVLYCVVCAETYMKFRKNG
jgi:5'-3' exonuclease